MTVVLIGKDLGTNGDEGDGIPLNGARDSTESHTVPSEPE